MKSVMLSMVLSGCGISPPIINPELSKYIQEFTSDCGNHGANLANLTALRYVNFTDDIDGEGGSVGVCWQGVSTYNYLWFTSIEVKRMPTEIEQKALMYHELGHCVLALDHVPDTIMSTNMLGAEAYSADWDNMVEALCNRYQ